MSYSLGVCNVSYVMSSTTKHDQDWGLSFEGPTLSFILSMNTLQYVAKLRVALCFCRVDTSHQ